MGDKKQEVWRLVGGDTIIQCTDCRFNMERALTPEESSTSVLEGMPIGVEYRCTAPDEICDFLKEKINSQKAYSSFREAYEDIPEEDKE